MAQLTHDSKIIIVGAGVFGLSTALHLARRGYRDVTIFDRQAYDQNQYAVSAGADAASADENKILRASYGGKKLYQDLAFSAMPIWRGWNEQLASTPQTELPPDLSPDIPLWHNCGYLRLSDHGLEDSEKQTQENFPPEMRHTQYRITDSSRQKAARETGIPPSKLDPFLRQERGLQTDGVLDMSAGFLLASRACCFALYLCQKAGVKTMLGPEHTLHAVSERDGKVKGITTRDGKSYTADLVIVACGGWTPSLIPQVEDLLETTSGTVLSFRLPNSRPELWDKFSLENFPVWDFNSGGYTPFKTIGGIYGLPRTPEGVVKIAFRGAKWTNYEKQSRTSGRPLSYPHPSMNGVPEEGIRVLRAFCEENMPELLELEPEYERLCWYADSVDNSFLIDYVPSIEGLVVASGGSGHGFKFLPVLGEHVVDVVESKDTQYTRLFKWRDVPEGKRNGLEEGAGGWRRLDEQKIVGKEHWRARSKL